MDKFMFATGIECSYPTIDGGRWRIDQLSETKHYRSVKSPLRFRRSAKAVEMGWVHITAVVECSAIHDKLKHIGHSLSRSAIRLKGAMEGWPFKSIQR